jgi:hypothetical protein
MKGGSGLPRTNREGVRAERQIRRDGLSGLFQSALQISILRRQGLAYPLLHASLE